MDLSKKIVGIVLSGGKSSRMGQEKGLLQFKEKPLIVYAIEAILPLSDQIVISTNTSQYDYLQFPIVKDEIQDCGPLGGIYSCMKAYKADYYLVISCDVPLVCTELYSDLINNINHHSAIIVCEQKRKHPLVGIYSKSSFPFIEKRIKNSDLKMMLLLEELNAKDFYLTDEQDYYHEDLLKNTNTKLDLKSLENNEKLF